MKEISENDYSIKELNHVNWLEIDGAISILSEQTNKNKAVTISKSEWFENIYRVKVDDSVPKEIHHLIEVVRGTMTYGYFYYPIFSLAFEQFFRIAETAIVKKCELLPTPKNKFSFKQKIKWLYRQDVMSKSSYDTWEKIVQLRNIVSHPKRVNIISTNIILQTVNSVIDLINNLFKDSENKIGSVTKGFIITYDNIPFSGFSQNGSKIVFNKEPYIFTNLPVATKMKTKLKIVIKDINDVEGLEKITTPIHLEIEKIYK